MWAAHVKEGILDLETFVQKLCNHYGLCKHNETQYQKAYKRAQSVWGCKYQLIRDLINLPIIFETNQLECKVKMSCFV